jgi:hypothetical protein
MVAPSVDYKMINFLHLDYSSMSMEMVGRFNIASVAPNPEDSSLKIKRILSVSPC